jgi:hypothetical protein
MTEKRGPPEVPRDFQKAVPHAGFFALQRAPKGRYKPALAHDATMPARLEFNAAVEAMDIVFRGRLDGQAQFVT